MALLVKPGTKDKVAVVDGKQPYADLLGCRNVQQWPPAYQLDVVEGPSGRKHQFEIWVDEEGLLKNAEPNLCATLAAHPYNEIRRRFIYGPALLVPAKKGASFTLEDWKDICRGVWAFEDSDGEEEKEDEEDEGEIEGEIEEDPLEILLNEAPRKSACSAREELVDRNAHGRNAANRRV